MNDASLKYIEWGSDVHAPKDDRKKLAELVELQKKYRIECCSYGTYFKLGETPLSELEGYIEAASMLGTGVLRLWCGSKNSQEYDQEQKERLFAECKEAAKIAREHNAILCMECHERTYTNIKEAALELMQSVDSPSFRMYWQPNQFRSVEENCESAQLLKPYTCNVHVFNWQGNDHYDLNDGVDVWKRYLSCFDGERALLLEFMPDDRIESLVSQADALRKIAEV